MLKVTQDEAVGTPKGSRSSDRDRPRKKKKRSYNVLFLCTDNVFLSVFAMVLLKRAGKGRFHAFSAVCSPGAEIPPLAVEQLKQINLWTEKLSSKKLEAFEAPNAPLMDFVIRICGRHSSETCPDWDAKAKTARWRIDRPETVGGTLIQKRLAFSRAFGELETRINLFVLVWNEDLVDKTKSAQIATA